MYSGRLETTKVFDRDLWYDPDVYDMYIIKEQRRSYEKLLDGTSKAVVLDIGGNRGYFAAYAKSMGAKTVVSVEPDPTNCEVFKLNQELGTILIQGAAGVGQGIISLYINAGVNKGLHSVVPKRGREKIVVPLVDFWQLIDTWQPSLLKIDCEGGEYQLGLLDRPFPPYVNRIAIEFDVLRYLKKDKIVAAQEGRLDELKDNILYQHYKMILQQFPVVLKDTSAGFKKFPWNILVVAERENGWLEKFGINIDQSPWKQGEIAHK